MPEARFDPASHPDLLGGADGQVALTGALLELERRLERLFLSWAALEEAREYRFGTFLPAREMARLDYFRSFPHLATFPVTLDDDPENLRRFAAGEPVDGEGALQLAELAPVTSVLTPAACYHFYVAFQGQELDAPRFVTTRATCFRREVEYRPLERQWAFGMREIVALGSADEVRAFLARHRERLEGVFAKLALPVAFEVATDPFFDPGRNPKHLMQKLDPVKHEMVLDGRLPIGSINFHHDAFGTAFEITRDGQPACSGCVAFGVERWIHALLACHGPDPADWPDLEGL